MTSRKERQLVYRLAIVLFIIGGLSYAAFPDRAPAVPVRIMFHTTSGKVLFDHEAHASKTGYALACRDCHHHPPADSGDTEYTACGKCHAAKASRMKTVAPVCNQCHSPEDYDLSEMKTRGDAFHEQCQTCHEQYGAGPGKSSKDCKECHTM